MLTQACLMLKPMPSSAPRTSARFLGPALLPCFLAPQGLCLSKPLKASLSASLPHELPPESLSDCPSWPLGPGCWYRAGRASRVGTTSAALSGACVSPVIGTQQSLQAPESPQGHGPSAWQSGWLRTLSGSRCVRAASDWEPEDLEEPWGLGGCWSGLV